MLISKENRFVFVHIQKTGGETVEHLLKGVVPDLERVGAKHARWREVFPRESAGEGVFSFCFVRNPWARLVSWHAMIVGALGIGRSQARADRHRKAHFRQARDNPLWRYVYDNGREFGDFVRDCTDIIELRPGVRYSFAFNQLDYICNAEGEVAVDFVGRQESYEQDLRTVFERLHLGVDSIPHKNTSRHRPYRDYYTAETRDLVARRFHRDIETFAYEF